MHKHKLFIFPLEMLQRLKNLLPAVLNMRSMNISKLPWNKGEGG